MIHVDQIKSWKDFEIQLSRIIEYKISLMYYGLDTIRQKEQYMHNIEQNDKELFALFDNDRSKDSKHVKKQKRKSKLFH